MCLVLDDDVANQLCTDTSTGFTGSNSLPTITWSHAQPQDVKKVHLYFRDLTSAAGYAQIGDMKITYAPSGKSSSHPVKGHVGKSVRRVP